MQRLCSMSKTPQYKSRPVPPVVFRSIIRTVTYASEDIILPDGKISDFHPFRFSKFIKDDFLSGFFNPHLQDIDYAVTEGTKVIGYVINGYFMDHSFVY